jgi:stage II sporulation protein D
MKRTLSLALQFIAIAANGQQIDIGILHNSAVKEIEIALVSGAYTVYADTTEFPGGVTYQLKVADRKVSLKSNEKILGVFDSVLFKTNSKDAYFSLRNISSSSKLKKYNNNLLVVNSGGTKLKLINRVEMENYLGGVIESEGGSGKHIEYYKVQAIISRTYALEHWDKHRSEGFQLCDGVHCQAYQSMRQNSTDIAKAVSQTRGLVLVDKDRNMAKCFFHANCGGQTSPADFVWNEPVDYCASVSDTFCTRSKQATWTKRIPAEKWKSYLVSEFGFNLNDTIAAPFMYWYEQHHRDAFFIHPKFGIPLRDLRIKFDLKSTWFSCYPEGDEIVLTGKGFGHGVGLCQEGAMRMATLGFKHEQILNFYFTGLSLVNYFEWLFLGQKAGVDGL